MIKVTIAVVSKLISLPAPYHLHVTVDCGKGLPSTSIDQCIGIESNRLWFRSETINGHNQLLQRIKNRFVVSNILSIELFRDCGRALRLSIGTHSLCLADAGYHREQVTFTKSVQSPQFVIRALSACVWFCVTCALTEMKSCYHFLSQFTIRTTIRKTANIP